MPRDVWLHDTASDALQRVEPGAGGTVGLYACGPTVYSRVHVGNARPYVTFSWLKRFLEHEGYATTFVANVTDVNDKIYAAAAAAGVPSAQLAQEMGEHYKRDTDALGLGRPDHEPLVTDHVEGIVELIGALLEREHAYVDAVGDVWFAVRSLPEYGALSHRTLDDLDQGEGREGAERKRDPLDFALWKAQKEGEDTAWDAPWGRGRPGWHIECSAMAEALLGVGFAVHGGGSDLVFPHHENEAAQTLAARGEPLARIWMHNGMLQLSGEKMAKSVGNIRSLADAVAARGREPLLLLFAGGHYRQPLAYDEARLEQAASQARTIREAGRRLATGRSPDDMRAHLDAFLDALAQDFHTEQALASVMAWVREANRRDAGTVGDADLRVMLGILGLDALLDADDGPPAELVDKARERDAARAAKDFATADRLRDELRAAGWEVRDGPDGPELVPAA